MKFDAFSDIDDSIYNLTILFFNIDNFVNKLSSADVSAFDICFLPYCPPQRYKLFWVQRRHIHVSHCMEWHPSAKKQRTEHWNFLINLPPQPRPRCDCSPVCRTWEVYRRGDGRSQGAWVRKTKQIKYKHCCPQVHGHLHRGRAGSYFEDRWRPCIIWVLP